MWQRTAFARFAGRAGAPGLLLAVGLLAGCPGPHLMPTPNVYVQTQANPFADVAPPLRTNTVDVLYATDRKPLPRDDGTLAYGYGRSPSLAVGSCVVEIPRWPQPSRRPTSTPRSRCARTSANA